MWEGAQSSILSLNAPLAAQSLHVFTNWKVSKPCPCELLWRLYHTGFIFWGSKITAYGDCSHEIKRRLLLERKVMTILDSILKNRDITLPTKVRLVKAMVFQLVIYGWESWAIKKTKHQRIDAFQLWCWRRLPCTAQRSNLSILKEISPGCSLEGLMLKLQYFGHLM